MKMNPNPNYDPTQKATNAKNKQINKALHVKGKKTTAKPRNKNK
jgi:hypothetical protein